MISFVIGIVLLQWFTLLPSLVWLIIVTLLFFAISFSRQQIIRRIAFLLCSFFLGFTWADYHATNALSKQLPPQDFGKVMAATGWIASIPKNTPLGLQFLLRLKTLDHQKQEGLLRVSWYQHHQKLAVGDLWRLPLKLKRIHGLVNPGGFDYQRWAFQQGIEGSSYVVNREHQKFVHHHSLKFPITRYRARLQAVIQSGIKDKNLAAIVTALSIGSKGLIAPDTWQVFQRTGTSHLIAISGLHVGLVVAVMYFFISWLWRFFPRLLLRIPAQRAGALAAMIISWLYGLLVGFSLPTQRAVIMITALMLSQLLIRHISLWYRLLLAFVVVIVCQPLAIFSASFWLSFSAVFWIAYIMVGRSQNKNKIASWCRLQCAIFLGLLPLTLFYFHQFSLVAFVANAIAIPWVTIFLVPICLFASVLNLISTAASRLLFMLSAKVLIPLWWFLSWLSHFTYAVWVHPINHIFIVLTMLVAILLLLAPKGFPGRYLSIIFCIPFFFSHAPSPKPGAVYLTLLDVGQGLSAVVRTAHHTLIYDTGPKYPTGFDAGRSVVIPYLQDFGIKHVDVLMISHGDNDHIGGAGWLLSHYFVNKVMTSIPQSHWQRPVTSCYLGQSWRWDDVDFRVLSPSKGASYQDNNSSCVLRIQLAHRQILLTGDILKSVERILLKHEKEELPATVLIAPHHGSRSSSSLAFVKAVHPSTVLIPVGYQNRYHFPAESVLKRYQNFGAQIFSTSKQGAIQVKMPSSGPIQVKTSYHKRHYWQHNIEQRRARQ